MNAIENYFETAVTLPEVAGRGDDLTASEQAFLEKYVGLDWRNSPAAKAALAATAQVEQVLSCAQAPSKDRGLSLEAEIMVAEELRLVSFHVGAQVFAVPIMMVQEVLRALTVTQMPGAPDFLAGVINLRGRVTPVVDLACLLEVPSSPEDEANFLVVCRLDDFQIGLQVRSIDTMHRALRKDIEWSVESKVGVYPAFLLGLLKAEDQLIKILSVSLLFKKVLKS